jgi:peroxiredoxin
MNRVPQLLLLGLVPFLVCAAQEAKKKKAEERAAPVSVGQDVTDFAITDANGKDWKLSEFLKSGPKGPAVFFFYCTTCGPCRLEELEMEKFYRALKGKAEIAAMVGSKGETAQKATAFNLRKGLSFPCVYDKSGDAASSFSARTTLTVIVDADRKLRYMGPLAQDGKAYAREALEAILAGKDVAQKEVKDASS